jgi:hypothetical protein
MYLKIVRPRSSACEHSIIRGLISNVHESLRLGNVAIRGDATKALELNSSRQTSIRSIFGSPKHSTGRHIYHQMWYAHRLVKRSLIEGSVP